MDVAIAIVTYQRPRPLRRLLVSLDRAAQLVGPRQRYSVVVVDNDPQGSGATALAAFTAQRLDISYHRHGAVNIASARNQALAQASARYVAFLDDDQTVTPTFFVELVARWPHHDASAIGAVFRCRHNFRAKPPGWLDTATCFPDRSMPSGSRVDRRHFGSGGMLIDRLAFLATRSAFRDDFGRTGGEDTALFLELTNRGERFVFLDEVEVLEEVPRERLRLGYVLRNHLRKGLEASRHDAIARGCMPLPLAARISRALHAGTLAAKSFLLAALVGVWWPRRGVALLARAVHHVGFGLGELGVTLRFYGRRHDGTARLIRDGR